MLFGAVALAAVSGAHAQSPRLRRVAIARSGPPDADNKDIHVFKNRLGELGWVEGSSIEYIYANAHGDGKRSEPAIAELLAQKPDVVFAVFGSMALVAKKLTQSVPIVFGISSNPEKSGLVASLARPGGNVTGVSTRELELLGKRVELLMEIRPGIHRVAVLTSSNSPLTSKLYLQGYSEQAKKVGIELLTVDARSAEELRPAFDRLSREGAQGMLGIADPVHRALRMQVVGHAARLRLPAVYIFEEYVEAGGLVSYGTDNVYQFRRAAVYVDKILRGAKPADLPVEEPTHFRLAVNLKAAREQGIKLPQSVLVRADQVIE